MEESNIYEDMSGAKKTDLKATENRRPMSEKRLKRIPKKNRKCSTLRIAAVFTMFLLGILMVGIATLAAISHVNITALESRDEDFDITIGDVESQLWDNSNADNQQFNESLTKFSQLMRYFVAEMVILNKELNRTNQRISDFQSVFEDNLTHLQINFESQITSLQESINTSNTEIMRELQDQANSLNKTNADFKTQFSEISASLGLVNNTFTLKTNNLQATVTGLLIDFATMISLLNGLEADSDGTRLELNTLQATVTDIEQSLAVETRDLRVSVAALNSSNSIAANQLVNLQNSVSGNNTMFMNELESLRVSSTGTVNQISAIQTSLSMFEITSSSQISNLQESVSLLTTTDNSLSSQINNVTSSNDITSTQLYNAWSDLNATNSNFMTKLNVLQASVDIINSSGILNQVCQNTTTMCVLSIYSNSSLFWINCKTPSQAILPATVSLFSCTHVYISISR